MLLCIFCGHSHACSSAGCLIRSFLEAFSLPLQWLNFRANAGRGWSQRASSLSWAAAFPLRYGANCMVLLVDAFEVEVSSFLFFVFFF